MEMEIDSNTSIIILVIEVFIFIAFFFGSFLNIVLVIIFVRRRGFRTTSNSVLTPLSLLSVVVTSVPPLFCTGWTLATNMASSSLILATLLIGLDQYLAIVTPLHYHSIVGGRRLVCVCLSAWILSLLLPLLALPASPLLPSLLCRDTQPDLTNTAVSITLAILLIVIPYLLIVIMHIKVFTSARDNSVKIRRNSVSSERRVSVTTHTKDLQFLQAGGGGPTLSRSSSVWSQMSQLMYREESKAARVTVLIVVVVGVTWSPHLSALLPPNQELAAPWLHHLIVAFLNSYSALSPVIFAFRSRRVQRDLRKVFGLRSRRSGQKEALSRLKSYSCPHLVLTSCQSIQAGPGMRTPDMAAWRTLTNLKTRQLRLNQPKFTRKTES